MENQIKQLQQLLNDMWQDYVKTNPPAQKIHDLLLDQGEHIYNDHIAFRTYNHPKVNIDVLAKSFIASGYIEKDQYHFDQKKLNAKHFEHPDGAFPKIFISELLLEEFDQEVNTTVNQLVEQIPADYYDRFDFADIGRPWPLVFKTYENLKENSEYAAWVAAFGFRPNHFTISVNHLKKYDTLIKLNSFLKDNGFKLNDSGGEIKGSPQVYLEQSSTLAYNAKIKFEDGEYVIPACYYEFAHRYPLSDGKLFQGFVAKSADKIFESTDKGQ
ncbi:MAG: DUF1338 domain-containing protein [Candidatus Cyclobacteriaceae bacterium M3_2C_046]